MFAKYEADPTEMKTFLSQYFSCPWKVGREMKAFGGDRRAAGSHVTSDAIAKWNHVITVTKWIVDSDQVKCTCTMTRVRAEGFNKELSENNAVQFFSFR